MTTSLSKLVSKRSINSTSHSKQVKKCHSSATRLWQITIDRWAEKAKNRVRSSPVIISEDRQLVFFYSQLYLSICYGDIDDVIFAR